MRERKDSVAISEPALQMPQLVTVRLLRWGGSSLPKILPKILSKILFSVFNLQFRKGTRDVGEQPWPI